MGLEFDGVARRRKRVRRIRPRVEIGALIGRWAV
jgi:hypothetical protein